MPDKRRVVQIFSSFLLSLVLSSLLEESLQETVLSVDNETERALLRKKWTSGPYCSNRSGTNGSRRVRGQSRSHGLPKSPLNISCFLVIPNRRASSPSGANSRLNLFSSSGRTNTSTFPVISSHRNVLNWGTFYLV